MGQTLTLAKGGHLGKRSPVPMDPRQQLYQDEWFRTHIQTIEKALLVLLEGDQSEEGRARRADVMHALRVSLGLEAGEGY